MIVDASIAAKWFLPEPGSEQAEKLLEGPQPLLAPRLIRLEVFGAITRQFRLGNLTEPKARLACDEWITVMESDALQILPDEPMLDDAITLALRLKHPFQDCMYLALARSLGYPLLTADEKFHQRAKKLYPHLQLLAVPKPH
jgi:predicted nucleic acid-binding protein